MSVQAQKTKATDGDDEADAASTELTEDQIFHVLQNERRRNVLRYLQDTDEPVRMRDVAEQVAAWEHDTTVEALTSDQRQRVYIPLYQSHLPKLDTEGIIDYQQSRGIVERRSSAAQLEPYLDVGDDEGDDRWDDYYIGATALAGLLLFGAVLELPVVSAISGTVIAGLVVLLYTSLTIGRFAEGRAA
ncbi:DUF7344 domain-containing protein [Saliphagus infecundisoli]|uniref:DUF7344 domain-containing protein n=1 Tax=Saliphagus infecundisoli TaxID=1849069 RepID=A0ABD5QKP6_9EURY|nr:hypothetical protein [Saliphagus infecundisoli]